MPGVQHSTPEFWRLRQVSRRGGGWWVHKADPTPSLFKLMLSTGLPELQRTEDLQYLREVFSIELSEDEATARWKK